jgi:hypothetical protein
MKQLYVVRWEIEAVVLAESEKDAYQVGADCFQDVVGDADSIPDDASPMQYLPGGWDRLSLPFGDDDTDTTIGAHIDAGAAPAYAALSQRLAAVKKDVLP